MVAQARRRLRRAVGPGRRPGSHDAPLTPGAARIVMVGAGCGAGQMRDALLRVPESAFLTVVLRDSTREDRAAAPGLAELVLSRGGLVVPLTGPRAALALDAARLRELIGDEGLGARELHVFGPATFAESVVRAARSAGVPEERIHRRT